MNFCCKILGHKWLYNFTTMPSKAICKRCSAKARFGPETLEWQAVDSFPPELGSDEQIKNRWSSPKIKG